MLGRFPRRADAWLFLALSLGSLLVSMTAVVGSLAHVGRPFPGFVVWDNLVVVALGRAEWTGLRAQVPFRAHVVRVDGQAVASRGALYDIVRSAPPGTVHSYVFEGPRGREERRVAAMTFTAWDYGATLGVYVLNGLAFLAVGLAVFYLKPDSRQSRALLAFGVVWGLYLVLDVDLFTAGRLHGLPLVLGALSPAAILHLGLTFPEPRAPVKQSSRPLVMVYAAGLVAGLAEVWMFHRWYAGLLVLDNALYLTLAGVSLLAMGWLAVGTFRGESPLARRRARVVLAGAITAFAIPVLALLAFIVLGYAVSFSLLTLTGFVFPLTIGYAVARHDLFEADRFVKVSLVYAVMTALMSFGYGGAVVLVDHAISDLQLARSSFFPIAFVLVVLATIVPLRDRVQRAVDRLFYRGRVDYKATVARASERMTRLLERDAIAGHLLATLREVLFIDTGTVWEREGDTLVRRGPGTGNGLDAIPANAPGIAAFEAHAGILSRDAAEESPRLRTEREALRALFTQLDATLLVPLLREGRPAGLLAVGRKRSGGPLSADDVDVLRTLANETAVALANAAALAELQQAQELLSRSERLAAIGELSAAVAHGIRNPLAGMRLATQLGLEHTAPGDPVREYMEDVLAEVDKLEAQVRGVLDFARPFEPRLEPTDLGMLVAGIVETLTPRLTAEGSTIAVDLPPDLPLIQADPTHLSHALQELVGNALDAMEDGGRVTISAAPAGDGIRRVRLHVADTGPGLPPEMRERVFQLFTTTKRKGTGLGLAVVRKIVERHGGTVVIEAGEPHGARFVVELPTAQRAMA